MSFEVFEKKSIARVVSVNVRWRQHENARRRSCCGGWLQRRRPSLCTWQKQARPGNTCAGTHFNACCLACLCRPSLVPLVITHSFASARAGFICMPHLHQPVQSVQPAQPGRRRHRRGYAFQCIASTSMPPCLPQPALPSSASTGAAALQSHLSSHLSCATGWHSCIEMRACASDVAKRDTATATA
jgi:hypothetical protein